MRVSLAFLRRDLRIAWSYRFSFFVQVATLVFGLVTLRFVSEVVGVSQPASLEQYGGDYFTFLLVGTGIGTLAFPLVKGFAGAVRANQVSGTFEVMLTTRVSGAAIVFNATLYSLLFAAFQLLAVWVVGTVFLGARFQLADTPLVLAVLLLTSILLAGVGLLAASFMIVFKQNEPVSGAFLMMSMMLSGIFYPTSVLPSWLGQFAPLLPLTHAVELLRMLLIQGADSSDFGIHFATLAGFCALLPIGLLTLNMALASARRSGSLGQY